MKKTVLIPLSAVALVVLLASAALAVQPGPGKGQGMGPGQNRPQLTQEQMDAAEAIFDKYADKADPVQVKLFSRNMELQALVNAGTTDRKAIQELVQEIADLHKALRDLRADMHDELSEATGVNFGRGMGFGHGLGRGFGQGFGPCGGGFGPGQGAGPGRGMGPGNGMGQGQGLGPCWQ